MPTQAFVFLEERHLAAKLAAAAGTAAASATHAVPVSTSVVTFMIDRLPPEDQDRFLAAHRRTTARRG